MNACELVTFVSTIACTLSKHLTTDELNILAALCNQLGDSLATIIAHQSICDKQAGDS
jgi:hypothetical protein